MTPEMPANSKKPALILQKLASHPEVKRRRSFFINSIEAAKMLLKEKNVKFSVDGKGWTAFIQRPLLSDNIITLGMWSTEEEKLGFLEDVYFNTQGS